MTNFIGFLKKYWSYLILAPSLVYFSFYYPWYFQIIFLLFSAAIIGLYFHLRKSDVLEIPLWPILGIAFAILLFSRIYPFFLSDWPLGYDTGIYKWHFEEAWRIFPSFSTGLYPGIFLITDLLYAIGFKSWAVLNGWYVFFDLLIPVAIFLYCRREFGVKVAAISAFLFAVSLAQAQAYSFILYKNIVALSVMFFAFLLIEKRSYWAIPLAAYLVFLQPPDFVIFGLTIAIYFILNLRDREKRRFILISTIIASILGFAAFYIINPQALKEGLNILINFKDVGEVAQKEGLFMSAGNYLGLSILYIPFALFAFAYLIKNRKFNLAFSYFLVVFVFIVFKLIFYKRFLIEFDIAVITLAGLGVYLIFRKFYMSVYGKITLVLLAAAMISVNIYRTLDYKPFISNAELKDIKWVAEHTEPESVAMATTSIYSPWILGFSNRPTIAPGMFDMNRWNFEEWMRFWTGDINDHLALWQKYGDMAGRPVYLFYGLQEPWPDFAKFPIYKRVSNFVWRFNMAETLKSAQNLNDEKNKKSVKK